METYTIRKGRHDAEGVRWPQIKFGHQGTLRFRIRFGKGCLVACPGVDRYDFNKATGLGLGDHRRESARLGWRGTGTHIELAGFFHVDGKFLPDLRGEMLLGAVKADEWVEVEITATATHLSVRCIDLADVERPGVQAKRGDRHWLPVTYLTNPFFGGNQTAQADCVIDVELLSWSTPASAGSSASTWPRTTSRNAQPTIGTAK